MPLTKEQKAARQAAKTAERVAELRAEGKNREADRLEIRASAARKQTKRLAQATAKGNKRRARRGRPLTAAEKVSRNSKFAGDAMEPRREYDRAEREGKNPVYTGTSEVEPQGKPPVEAGQIEVSDRQRGEAQRLFDHAARMIGEVTLPREMEGADYLKACQGLEILHRLSGVGAGTNGGGKGPTTAIQVNLHGGPQRNGAPPDEDEDFPHE